MGKGLHSPADHRRSCCADTEPAGVAHFQTVYSIKNFGVLSELQRHQESAAHLTTFQRDIRVERPLVLDDHTEENDETLPVLEEERWAVRKKRQTSEKETPRAGDAEETSHKTGGLVWWDPMTQRPPSISPLSVRVRALGDR